MKGKHRIIVQNKRLRYDFEIQRNLTIIRGDSATGKTTLVEMVREYTDNGDESSIELISDKKCYVLQGATWKGQLTDIQDSIVFIDEGNSFVFSDEFSDTIQKTDNYYVIVTREGLPNLPYSAEEIYGIRLSGRYGGLKQQYNEFYHIYDVRNTLDDDKFLEDKETEKLVITDQEGEKVVENNNNRSQELVIRNDAGMVRITEKS